MDFVGRHRHDGITKSECEVKSNNLLKKYLSEYNQLYQFYSKLLAFCGLSLGGDYDRFWVHMPVTIKCIAESDQGFNLEIKSKTFLGMHNYLVDDQENFFKSKWYDDEIV